MSESSGTRHDDTGQADIEHPCHFIEANPHSNASEEGPVAGWRKACPRRGLCLQNAGTPLDRDCEQLALAVSPWPSLSAQSRRQPSPEGALCHLDISLSVPIVVAGTERCRVATSDPDMGYVALRVLQQHSQRL